MPARVLIVSEQAKRGGAERSSLLLAEDLNRNGVPARIGFCDNGPLVDDAVARRVPLVPGAGRFLPGAKRVRFPGLYVAARSARLVHLSSLETRCIAVGRFAASQGRPLVAHLRMEQQLEPARRLHELGAFVVTNSSATERTLRERGVSRVRFVANGIDPGWADVGTDRGAVRRALGVPDGAVMALMVANMAEYKALDLAFPLLEAVQREVPDLWVVHVGASIYPSTRWYEDEIRSLAVASACADRTMLLGSRADVADLTNAADLTIVPSHGEGTARAILESWSASTAVAAADRPGLNDLVDHGRNGVLFDWDDPSTAAQRIAELARSARLRRSYGEQGHGDLLEHYSHAAHTRQILEVYAELFDGAAADRRRPVPSPPLAGTTR